MKNHLRRVKRHEIKNIASVFALAFTDDPLYVYLCPDKDLRAKLLPIFFKHYLLYMERYGDILADSSDYKGLMLWYYSRKQAGRMMSFIHVQMLLVGGLEVLKHVSIREYLKYVQGFKTFGSDWIDAIARERSWDEYAHFDMMVIAEHARGKGLFRTMVEPCIESLDERGLPCTIETHNPRNVEIYKGLGFTTVKEIVSEDQSLVQYCMVREIEQKV